MLHILLVFLGAICCIAAGGVFSRGAGGLWSSWAGRDLGDTAPRIAWGLVALVPPVALLWPPEKWWGWLVLVACAVGLGACRGAGWGSSLSLGFTEAGGKPTAATLYLGLVFAEHASMMIFLGPLYFAARAVDACAFPWHTALLAVVVWFVLGTAFLALAWLFLYIQAWRFPVAWPLLHIAKNDPPPWGEFLVGCFTVFCFELLSAIFSIAL